MHQGKLRAKPCKRHFLARGSHRMKQLLHEVLVAEVLRADQEPYVRLVDQQVPVTTNTGLAREELLRLHAAPVVHADHAHEDPS